MTLGIGTVHPPGEGLEYDGYYYRKCEMNKLAEALKGKPLLLNHEKDTNLGQVCEAWMGQDGQLNILFELSETFNGYLAHGLISEQVCGDLSLGHDVKVDLTNHRVLEKVPTEVSICTNGARRGTHIHLLQSDPIDAAKLKKRYISMYEEHLEKNIPMSTDDLNETTPDQPMEDVETKEKVACKKKTKKDSKEDDEATKNFKQELLDLVTKQQAEVSVLQKKFKAEHLGTMKI